MTLVFKALWLPKGWGGIAIAPFIFMRDPTNATLLAHERQHIEDQYTYWILPYFIMYFCSPLFRARMELRAMRKQGRTLPFSRHMINRKYGVSQATIDLAIVIEGVTND